MTVRVPELAPALGRLIVPRRTDALWIPLDDVADELVTRVIEAAGEARRLTNENAPPDRVLEALGRTAWLAAWEHAVRRAADRVADSLDDQIERIGRGVRMPRRKRRIRKLTSAERRSLTARLSVGGAELVKALDDLARVSTKVRSAESAGDLDDETHHAWQDAVQTAARRLEAAWLALEDAVRAERTRWDPELSALAHWRPSLWPVLVWWAVGAGALLWLGLILGGFVDAPYWLAQLLHF
ncbi:MAG TPA: hypothetical protein VEV39_13360 [Gemmatimonadales bacterium]|nr:hypothetical protein [Gemmatimonadales bacterium]